MTVGKCADEDGTSTGFVLDRDFTKRRWAEKTLTELLKGSLGNLIDGFQLN